MDDAQRNDDARHESWYQRERARRFRGWSIGLGIAGPVLGFTAICILLGFDLSSSTGGHASPADALVVTLVALGIGVAVPVVGAVVLVVRGRRARVATPAGALLGGAAGVLTALLCIPWTVSTVGTAAAYHSALDRTTSAERQDPRAMREELVRVYHGAVRALPDARPGQYNGSGAGRLTSDGWVDGNCRLSVGWDGTDWQSVTVDSYEVDDVAAALDAARADAAARGHRAALERDADGTVRELTITVRAGTVSASPELGGEVTHDPGGIELVAHTHCVR